MEFVSWLTGYEPLLRYKLINLSLYASDSNKMTLQLEVPDLLLVALSNHIDPTPLTHYPKEILLLHTAIGKGTTNF